MSDPHVDDETLSAILDGEEPPSTHLDACPSCRARAQELQTASHLIGAAVSPPDAAQREAAIATALSAGRPARGRWRPSGPLLAAAAVVLAIAALVPILVSRGDDAKHPSAARDAGAETRTPAANGPAQAQAMMAPATVQAGDLGPIDGDLRERVTAALGGGQREAPLPDTPFACDNDLRAMDDKAGTLVLFGQATVNDRPGYVLVYSIIGTDPPRLAAYVVATDNCASILQFASFTAPDAGAGATGIR